MSLRRALWASQRFPGGSGLWRGGLWNSQRLDQLQSLINDLFAGSTAGAIIVPDPSLTDLWVDESRTTRAVSDGDLVWWVDDLSTNGNNFPAPIAGQRPTLRTDGTTWWLEHNGFVRLTIPDTGITTTSSTYGFSIHKYPSPDGGQDRSMLRGAESNAESWFFVFAAGNAAAAFNNVTTPGTVYVDNVETAITTRGEAHTQVITGDPIITSGTILGSSFTTPTNYLLSYTPDASGAGDYETFNGDLFAYAEVGRVLTMEERTELNDFLKSRQRAA